MRHVWGGIILSEQGRGQSQGSGERWPERTVSPELGQVLRHTLGWARAGGGSGVSSPVIFKEVFSKAPGVSCTPRVLSSTVLWRSQPPSGVTGCVSQSPQGTVTFLRL